jgi:predicted transcriptional regulator
MESPCQKIVWEVLPAIRAAVAVELVQGGMSQAEASRRLEIAPSAVSQYLSGRRGYRIEFGDDVKKSVALLARDLIDNRKVSLTQRTCEICRQLRDEDERCAGMAEKLCGPSP